MNASVRLGDRRFGGYEMGSCTISVSGVIDRHVVFKDNSYAQFLDPDVLTSFISKDLKNTRISIEFKSKNPNAFQQDCFIQMSRDEAIKLALAILSAVVKATLTEKIKEALSTLTPREEQILKMRFGIGYETHYTLDEIGRYFSLTPERIRQIEKRALKKIEDLGFWGMLKSLLAMNKER